MLTTFSGKMVHSFSMPLTLELLLSLWILWIAHKLVFVGCLHSWLVQQIWFQWIVIDVHTKANLFLFLCSHFFCFQPCQAGCNVGTDLLQERTINCFLEHSLKLLLFRVIHYTWYTCIKCGMQECKNAQRLTKRNKN